MVQVDVFWSFAVGAGFAACASRQLEEEETPFESKSFIKTLLWLSIFFVPSGAVLLWGFPRWETMQVGTYENIPAWLVALFCGTNITQGILGYYISYKLIRAGKTYAANLMWILGYFGMFFILIHGWDGTGYKRFFYCATKWSGDIIPWNPDTFSLLTPITWLISPVAITLLIMGIILMPFLFMWMNGLLVEGEKLAASNNKQYEAPPLNLVDFCKIAVFGVIGSSIIASILIHLMGWMIGGIIFTAIIYFVLLKEGGIIYKMFYPAS